MSRFRRIANVLTGILLILFSLLFVILDKTDAIEIIIWILCVTLLIHGLKELLFYLTLARCMVGGRSVLYRAVISIDMGLFALSLSNVSIIYIMLYLAGLHLLSGAADILRAVDALRIHADSWRIQFLQGAVNTAMALLCLVFIRSISIAVTIYAIGLGYAGLMRIVRAMQKTEIVYIS